MEQTAGGMWTELRARRLADPAARARYTQTRETLAAVRRILLAIEQERERRGLSKAALAHRAGMQPAAVRRLLTGAGGNPTLRTVISVADALGLEVELRPVPVSPDAAIPDEDPRHREIVTAPR